MSECLELVTQTTLGLATLGDRITGGTANFSCTVFNMTGPDYSLNWYKWDDKTQQNTLVQKSRRNDSSHLKGETFLFSLLNVTKNNSGIYFCSLISFHLKEHTITESHKANLTVTERVPEPRPEETPKEKEKEDNGKEIQPQERDYQEVPLLAVVGAGLLFVLAALCYFLIKAIHRRRSMYWVAMGSSVNIFLSSCCLQEEDPPAVSVYTVDYGVLEFHAADSATRAPPKVFSSDRTEYATIIFPQEKPITVDPDKKNRRAKHCPDSARPC
uniref:Ig-like domain-containing protein n=1 Tax=Salvator merianae TaxID=96440 RepID=A0A8D0DSD0_SALMN